jgi:hypothetical protein
MWARHSAGREHRNDVRKNRIRDVRTRDKMIWPATRAMM